MVIHSGCVTLRAIEDDDFDLLYEMMSSEEIEKAMGHCTLPISKAEQREWMNKFHNSSDQIRLMIELSNKKTIGLSMLFDIDMKNGTAEFGHKISAPAEDRIRGDVVDAVNGMLNYAFNYLRLNCVTARVIEGNIFAEKTLRKVGFQLEGTLRQRVFQEGEYLDMNSFSITKDEFNSKRGEVKNEL